MLDFFKYKSENKHKFYFPYNYNYEYDTEDSIKIKSITCTDPLLPKVGDVSVNRLPDGNFPVFTNKIFTLAGRASRDMDIMISAGCTTGCCSFKVAEGTSLLNHSGLVPIESVVGRKKFVVGSIVEDLATDVWRQEDDYVTIVSTEIGNQLKCSKDHIWLTLDLKTNHLVEKRTHELKKNQYVLVRKGNIGYNNQYQQLFLRSNAI